MTRKLDFIPEIPNYEYIRQQMKADLDYRLQNRKTRTSLGRPLYYRINVQVIMTHECPYNCPFCLERQNPMMGEQDFDAQITALKRVLKEHPSARLTITGGEPGLYPEHVKELIKIFNSDSEQVYSTVNTTGYDESFKHLCNINLSVNPYVSNNVAKFPDCTYQTVLPDSDMHLQNLGNIIETHPYIKKFSFRYISGLTKKDYDVTIFNELRNSKDVKVGTFRIGDFFTYVTFDYKGVHCRITLGDMFQQTHNDYQDEYSNIIIHPDGKIGVKWK